MDGLLVCAAQFLASAALCRYSSDRDDIQGEHWKDAWVPQNSRKVDALVGCVPAPCLIT